MSDGNQHVQSDRSPQTPAARFELYTALFIVWLALSFVFGELRQAESSTARTIYWAVSMVMVVLYGAVFVGLWWRSRRESDEG